MSFLYSTLNVGDNTSFSKTITAADVLLFAAVSGDQNQLHINDEFAKQTKFGQRIAHGMLSASLISTALTLAFSSSVYVSQSLTFKKPVFIGDTITAVATCVEKRERNRAVMDTRCYNQNNECVLEGEAVCRLPDELPQA